MRKSRAIKKQNPEASTAIAVVKGLADEEKSEQYVHHRVYWCVCIAILYIGLFLIGSGMNR